MLPDHPDHLGEEPGPDLPGLALEHQGPDTEGQDGQPRPNSNFLRVMQLSPSSTDGMPAEWSTGDGRWWAGHTR